MQIKHPVERNPLDNDLIMPLIASILHENTYGEAPEQSTPEQEYPESDIIESTETHTENTVNEINLSEESITKNSMNIVSRAFRKFRDSKLISTAIEETKDSGRADKLLLGGTLLGYANDIGPGTEWATAKIGKEMLELVAEHGNIPLTAATVGLSIAAFSFIYNSLTGLNMNRNLRLFPKTIDIISKSKFGQSNVLMNSRDRSTARKFMNVYTVGAASVNLEDSLTDPEFIEKKKGVKRTLGSSALVAAGSLAIGAIAGGGIQYALNENNLDLGYRILGHLTNPLIWMGLFVTSRTVDYRKNKQAHKDQAQT